jgi:DNA-binding response OmpR family regulator
MPSVKKILVADDDATIRELLQVNLAAAGYRVTMAAQGGEALELLLRKKPDLLILDIMMPEMDGWELCKIIRDHPELSALKILILSAKGTDRDKMIGREILKANEYITKPFDLPSFLETVRRLLHE